MRRQGVGLGLLCTWAAVAGAQTHAIKKTENVVRALAVYEWTGDPAKPTGSRVVPVSLFINGELRDAGVYLANPVPLVLDYGTIFELEHAGVRTGSVELALARRAVESVPADGGQGEIEDIDSWVGYGKFKPAEVPAAAPAKKSGALPQVVTSGGKGGPHFNSKPASPDPAEANEKPAAVDHSSAAGGSVSATGGDHSAEDSGKDDAERPTLRRRTPTQEKAAEKKRNQASVTGVGSLNDDPDRPLLGRGAPGVADDLPPLLGLPAGMHQAVGVSDARDRDEHPFTRPWDSPAERSQVLASMQVLARAGIAAYQHPSAIEVKAPHASKAAAAQRRSSTPSAAPAEPPLTEDDLQGFVLSYGGAATYVYTATLPVVGQPTLYVSVVAQQEAGGSLRQALASVTDSAHMDRTPQMRLVDAVDAEASNRASLLFELRAAKTRQFALYRVIAAQADQTFATGTIPEER